MIGTKLAHYEITSHLGSGGMGDVYQATDSKLGRNVAIKFLPAAVASDADRLSRFRREAQVLASLNHPNIAHIYGLEESGETRCIVMELVEGETLQARITRGPIPVDESLTIAKQIAEALEAAHEKGVIHRDLKPGNVMLTSDGRVKVLDFGLAKAYDANSSNPAMSNSPTIASMAATNAGIIMGTAGYMSPEQARGKNVDKRADIWAFGAVLYEMLTGQRAFPGEDLTDTLAAVVKVDPNWEAIGADVSPRVRQVLRVCLQKDPRQRAQAIGDVRLALEGAFETAAAETTVSAPSSAPGGRLPWMAFAVAVLVAAVLAIPAVRHLGETPPPETRLEINTPITTDPMSFALSPDGRQIVFVASGDGASRLWLRSRNSTTARPLAGTEGAVLPFWSPDNRSVGFFADGKLKRLDIDGGKPQTLAAASGPRGGTWNADGIILFAPTSSGPVFRVLASGGEAAAVTKRDKQNSHRFPQFLPDGRQFLFYALGTPETAGIYLGSLDTPETKRLTAADVAGVYLSSGWLLWVRDGTLVAQRLDLGGKALTGDKVTLADPVAFDTSTATGAVSVSAAGLVAYRAVGANRRQLAWFDRAGKALGTFGAPDEAFLAGADLSPDGRRVAVHRTVQGNTDVWILDGTRASRFTFDAALDRWPGWSPDGSRIVFSSNRNGTVSLYTKLSSGSGTEELLLESAQDNYNYDWSPDGRFILYISRDPQTYFDGWVLPMSGANASATARSLTEGRGQEKNDGDRKPWVFLKTNFDERTGVFSPDGRWVAYHSNESGRYEVYVRPFVAPDRIAGATGGRASVGAADNRAGGQWQVSTEGGVFPRWRRDGKEVYYLGPNGEMMAAPITATGTTLEPGAPTALFPTRIFGGGGENGQGLNYDVAADGRFLINTVLDDASSPITLIQNWTPPAK